MLTPIRKAVHAAVARALAQAEASDLALHYLALAIHHRESDSWDEAQRYFYEAGLRALAPGGLGAAVECFEQAMQALLRLPATAGRRERRIEIYRALHYTLIPLGRSVELRRHTDEIEALVDGGDRRLEGYVAVCRASDAYFTGTLPQAIADADRALVIAQETADARLRDLAHHYLMFACHDHGDFARALGVIEARLSELQFEPTHMSIDTLVTCQGYRAGCHLSLGDFAAARVAAAEAQRNARRWDSDYFVVLAKYITGVVELNATNWSAAIGALEPALALARRRDVGLMLPAICSALGLAYVHLKQSKEGISLLEQAVAGIADGITMWGAIYEYRLAEGYFVAGRVVAAAAAVKRALAAAEARGELISIGWACWLEGEIALAPPILRAHSSSWNRR
jgi:tetratricopeptide (TPR) repeat protein